MPKTVVSALLYNSQGQVLLQHRDDNPYTVFPGHWGLFGGGVEKGESLEEALDREIWEELEYRVQHKELWLIAREARADFHMFLVPIDVGLEQLKLNEGQGFGFFDIQEALNTLRLPPVTQFVLRAYELLSPLRVAQTSKVLRRICGAVLYNPQGQILLQHRDNNPNLFSPGTWDLFGGHALENETPEEALERELWEELGHSVKQKDLWIITPNAYATFYDFLVPIDVTIGELKLNEGQDFGFFTTQEALEKLRLSEGSRAIIKTFEYYQHYQQQTTKYTAK